MSGYAVQTGVNGREAAALIAPLIGWDPADIKGFVVLGIDRDRGVGFGASGNLTAEQIPGILRALANAIDREIGGGTT